MGAHLRDLARCSTCGKPATHQLYNTWNGPLGCYCARHANEALAAFIRRAPDQAPPTR